MTARDPEYDALVKRQLAKAPKLDERTARRVSALLFGAVTSTERPKPQRSTRRAS